MMNTSKDPNIPVFLEKRQMPPKKEQNVKIPLSLLLHTIYLMEHLEVFGYDLAIQQDYHEVYAAFLKKRQDLELRKSYAKIIFAEDEDARLSARMNYLRQKRENDEFYNSDV